MSLWTPQNPFTYEDAYPKTPILPSVFDSRLQDVFVKLWNNYESERAHLGLDSQTSIILVRGLLGAWMPGHFRAVRESLHALGVDVRVAPTLPAGTVEENAKRIRDFLSSPGFKNRKFIFFAHSKGGLDLLTSLSSDSALKAKTQNVILVQTPREASPVLESIFLHQYPHTHKSRSSLFKEKLFNCLLRVARQDQGCLELTGSRLTEIVASVDGSVFEFPVLAVSSWSVKPTAWLDSFHGRLAEIRPGVAHDGQFFTQALIWPQFPNLLLKHVDHAQAVVGGNGFDYARLWLSLLLSLTRESK